MLGHRNAMLPQRGTLPLATRNTVVARAALTLDAPKRNAAPAAVQLPPSLQNNVVVLDAPNSNGGTTKVYLMGVSHVSKVQAEQVKELIRAVRPEVVMLELCKDRVGLLVDDRPETQASNLWHCRKVSIEGLPNDPAWPTAAQLKQLLVTRSGRAISTQDIEADVFTLLSTGLFKSARPGAANAGLEEAPAFSVTQGSDGNVQLLCVPPLGGVKFTVEPRELAPVTEFSVRVDSSLKDRKPDPAQLEAVGTTVLSDVKEGVAPLIVLLRAKQSFAEVMGGPVQVAFSGVESGRVEAIVKAVKATDRPYVSGFESSAVNGEGWGIEPFRPARPLHKLSSKMFLTTAMLESMRSKARGSAPAAAEPAPAASAAADHAAPSPASAAGGAQPRSEFRIWTDEEIAAAQRADPSKVPLADAFRAAMTLLYARAQAQVGRKVGIERGAAWQAALQAASEVGAQQVLLSDRPTPVTERRLADGLFSAAAARIGGALGILISTISATVVLDAPFDTELGAVGVSILASLACLWPVVKPFVEIQQLADMTAEQIEEAVRAKQPLGANTNGKLFGEDALLDWPGADKALLEERDEFMARAAASAAAGAESGLCPAYVFDRVEGQPVWRLMQAEGAPPETCPPGFADGAYRPLRDVRSIVKVVGTAHVQGMVQRWADAVRAPQDVVALVRDPNAPPPSASPASSTDQPSSSS